MKHEGIISVFGKIMSVKKSTLPVGVGGEAGNWRLDLIWAASGPSCRDAKKT